MHRQIATIAYYTLLEALRNRLVWLVLAVAIGAVGLGGFLDQLAVTESRQIQAALIAALARACAVFILATFVVTSMLREFADKGLELVMALPLPRYAYLLGKLAGFGAVALCPALLFGALMLLFAPPDQVALWATSLLCELWLVAAVGLLCVLTFRQVTSALSATMAFYLGARAMTSLQALGGASSGDSGVSHRLIGAVLDAAGAILPRLDEFTRTEWLVHHGGKLSELSAIGAQSALFLLLVVAAALFDLYRKNI